MRNTFVESIIKRARIDDRIFIVTPDMGYNMLEDYIAEFPDRYLNVGIAEQNAIGVAAGLALSGKLVYVYSIVPFLTMRCFEQIRLDVAYMNTNVRLIGVGGGLSYGAAGATHHAIEDIAIMRALPNMKVCCPGDPVELQLLLEEGYQSKGPIYYRLGNNGEEIIHTSAVELKFGKSLVVKEGDDIALITTGNMLEKGLEIVNSWENEGTKATLLSMPCIKPFDVKAIRELIRKDIPIITLEEHNIIGGLGSAVAEIIAESNKAIKFKRVAINDCYSHFVGSQSYLREKFNLDIVKSI
ncbi:transketolase family protein [Bacillus thuringiensis]|uniref:transketolase family protein n=1 Tax=Bacillus thuringiensis TaxID=1428 RepID=UPI00119CD295|nr:transketolase C-terminal domain-containing protein [Bacillus thuringiensis]